MGKVVARGGTALAQFQSFLREVGALFTNLFLQPDWRNLFDIAIMTVLIYHVIKLLIRTRASAVFKGVAMVLLVAWLSDALQLNALNWLLQQLISMGVLVLVIMFQPELRRGLEQIGRSNWSRHMFTPQRRQRTREMENLVQEIVKALNNMSRKRIGALIVIERHTGLAGVIDSGTVIDAEISSPLIENIFEPNTPLHDGAVIIRGERIVAAACILQLTDDHSLSRELGTRHRAAIGITESTDAVSLIVSEETGIISMARDGKLTRYLDTKSLTILLTELFMPDDLPPAWMSVRSSLFGARSSKRKGDGDAP